MGPFRKAFGDALKELSGELMPSLEAELHRQFELFTTPRPPVAQSMMYPELVRTQWQRRKLRYRQRRLRARKAATIAARGLMMAATLKAINTMQKDKPAGG